MATKKEKKEENGGRKEKQEEVLRCSFCNKSQREVKKLIAGPTAFICNECVDICLDIIAEDRELEMRKDLMTAEQLENELNLRVVGQANAKRALSLGIWNHLVRKQLFDRSPERKKANLFLIGPPGTGKTWTVRCLAEILKLPWAIVDATRLTGQSYFKNEDVFDTLYRKAEGNLERAENGLICFDQLDRIAYRGGVEDPGRRVQESLLEILEGAMVSVKKLANHPPHAGSSGFLDTSGILFVACASFARETLASSVSQRREQLIQKGFLPELVDRFGLILELEPLSESDLKTLLSQPQGLLEEYRALFKADRVDLTFSDAAVEAMAKAAFRNGGGARSLRAILENVALDLSQELFSKSRPLELTVDEPLVSRSL